MTFVTQFLSRSFLASALLVGVAGLGTAWAQPSSGGPTAPTATAVPIDGGASMLLAAGVGLGIRRLRKSKMPAH